MKKRKIKLVKVKGSQCLHLCWKWIVREIKRQREREGERKKKRV